MSTGALIRDFSKEYRELRYSNSGSILLSEIEHNAYRNSLTLEITHTDGQRYENLKTLPDNSHYGYVTLFRGSSVAQSIPIKYTKFRVFDIINNGIWQYHQSTENRLIEAAEKTSLIRKILPAGFVSDVIDGAFDWLETQIIWTYDLTLARWIFSFGSGGVTEMNTSGGGGSGNLYRAFPVATPFPDIAKFKGDLPCSFLWRLESWYLVNPAVYIVDNPTDTEDETDGEDEYPEPENGDGDGDGDEFPNPDPRSSGSDPRDFGESGIDPTIQVLVRYTVRAFQSGCAPFTGSGQVVLPFEGSLEYSLQESLPVGSGGCPGGSGFGKLELITPAGNRVLIVNAVLAPGSSIDSVEILN